MKAYKVFNEDWKCMEFQYEVGKTYEMKEEPELCVKGFHACKQMQNCFNYYNFDTKNKIAEVELLGEIVGQDGDKQVTNKIKIIKELTWEEMLVLANTGQRNSGNRNSGNSNSGHSNSGHRNSGDRNSGYSNLGDSNSGCNNSGDSNSGYSNSGCNNSGNRNSGDLNSGDCNSGNRNSGDCNSGDWNSGDWNSTDRENGFFNSKQSKKIRVFNKWCLRKTWEKADKPYFIYNINLTKWISWSDMTEQEKKDFPKAYVYNGYLKTLTYKDAWKVAYTFASDEDIKLLKALPNFNVKLFKEITGISV